MMDHKRNHSDNAVVLQNRVGVQVECPGEGDVIAQPSYTFNIEGAPEAESVEVSIDKGSWMPCREALGIWWYDWSGFDKGKHQLVARTRVGGAIKTISAVRRFSVA
ncbi:MAG: hypothetical protein NTX64_00385 [Elusimicrobia bacterium]|nr:hypothetical protein [Elusimicrobiota bacterium]